MSQSLPRIIVIAGPTAVGKTAVALEVASYLQVPIVSFDSRQCYRELCIGVARPEPEQLKQVPHYFIADHSIEDSISAAYYEQYATQKVAALIDHYGQVVMVGGTGLYWRAFWKGFDEIPAIDPAIRSSIAALYEQNGLGWLQTALAEQDPLFATHGDMQNPRRVMRALEVFRSTGKSILSFQKEQNKTQPYKTLGIGLQLPRPELNLRIEQRVEAMMEQGLEKEAYSLIKYENLNALNTVGYRELFEYFKERITLDQAIAQIKLNTRHYAKRQMTWFGKDPLFTWFTPYQLKEIISLL
ncbi:MAG: tRNA (adenosine(37)-N6)-dimethylallyltransferase MiaA [Sphingomonadales bacterium]